MLPDRDEAAAAAGELKIEAPMITNSNDLAACCNEKDDHDFGIAIEALADLKYVSYNKTP